MPSHSRAKPVVAVINPSAVLGGAELSLLEILHRCRDHCCFHLIVPDEGPLVARAEAVGTHVWRLKWPAWFERTGERNGRLGVVSAIPAASMVPAIAWRLRRRLAHIGAQVVITNGIKAHVVGALALDRTNSRLIWYARDGLEGRHLTVAALRRLSHRCDAVIAISNYVAAEVQRAIAPRVLPIRVVYNIVDLSRFQPGLSPPPDLRKPPGEVWFGMLGALTPLKGQDIFLDAAEIVLQSVPCARFLIVGTNPYRTEGSGFEMALRKRAESSALQGRVSFLGYREDTPSVLASLDILVQCNRGPEGLGRSVLEAMAVGVPVIAVDRWGPAELVQDGSTGLLTPFLDVPGLAERMVMLASNPDLRGSLAASARAWVEANLNPESLAEEVLSIIESVAMGTLPPALVRRRPHPVT